MPVVPMEIDGEKIWVEVEDTGGPALTGPTAGVGYTAAWGGGQAGGAADGSVQQLTRLDVATTLKALVRPVRAALDELAPEELTVELSLGIKGEVGVFVAKSEGNATLKVTAKWKKA